MTVSVKSTILTQAEGWYQSGLAIFAKAINPNISIEVTKVEFGAIVAAFAESHRGQTREAILRKKSDIISAFVRREAPKFTDSLVTPGDVYFISAKGDGYQQLSYAEYCGTFNVAKAGNKAAKLGKRYKRLIAPDGFRAVLRSRDGLFGPQERPGGATDELRIGISNAMAHKAWDGRMKVSGKLLDKVAQNAVVEDPGDWTIIRQRLSEAAMCKTTIQIGGVGQLKAHAEIVDSILRDDNGNEVDVLCGPSEIKTELVFGPYGLNLVCLEPLHSGDFAMDEQTALNWSSFIPLSEIARRFQEQADKFIVDVGEGRWKGGSINALLPSQVATWEKNRAEGRPGQFSLSALQMGGMDYRSFGSALLERIEQQFIRSSEQWVNGRKVIRPIVANGLRTYPIARKGMAKGEVRLATLRRKGQKHGMTVIVLDKDTMAEMLKILSGGDGDDNIVAMAVRSKDGKIYLVICRNPSEEGETVALPLQNAEFLGWKDFIEVDLAEMPPAPGTAGDWRSFEKLPLTEGKFDFLNEKANVASNVKLAEMLAGLDGQIGAHVNALMVGVASGYRWIRQPGMVSDVIDLCNGSVFLDGDVLARIIKPRIEFLSELMQRAKVSSGVVARFGFTPQDAKELGLSKADFLSVSKNDDFSRYVAALEKVVKGYRKTAAAKVLKVYGEAPMLNGDGLPVAGESFGYFNGQQQNEVDGAAALAMYFRRAWGGSWANAINAGNPLDLEADAFESAESYTKARSAAYDAVVGGVLREMEELSPAVRGRVMVAIAAGIKADGKGGGFLAAPGRYEGNIKHAGPADWLCDGLYDMGIMGRPAVKAGEVVLDFKWHEPLNIQSSRMGLGLARLATAFKKTSAQIAPLFKDRKFTLEEFGTTEEGDITYLATSAKTGEAVSVVLGNDPTFAAAIEAEREYFGDEAPINVIATGNDIYLWFVAG